MDLYYQYYLLSKDFEFPDRIEVALENDYVENSNLYDEKTFNILKTLPLLHPDLNVFTCAEILELVRTCHKNRS